MSFAKSKRFSYSATPSERGSSFSSGGFSKHIKNLTLRENMRKDSKTVGSGCVNRNSKSENYKGNQKDIHRSPVESSSNGGDSRRSSNIDTIFDNVLFEHRPWIKYESELERIKSECLNLEQDLKKYNELTKEDLVTEIPNSDDLYVQMRTEVNCSIEHATDKIKNLFEETVSDMEKHTEQELESLRKKINKSNKNLFKLGQNKCQQTIYRLHETVNTAMEKISSKQKIPRYEQGSPHVLSNSLTWDDFGLDLSMISEERPCKQELLEEDSKQYLECQCVIDEDLITSEIFSKLPIYIHKGYNIIKDIYEISRNKLNVFTIYSEKFLQRLGKWGRPPDHSILTEQEKKIDEQAKMIDVLTELINADQMERKLRGILEKQKKGK